MSHKIKATIPKGLKPLIRNLPLIFDTDSVRLKCKSLESYFSENEMPDDVFEDIFNKWAKDKPEDNDPHKIAKRVFDIIKDEMFVNS